MDEQARQCSRRLIRSKLALNVLYGYRHPGSRRLKGGGLNAYPLSIGLHLDAGLLAIAATGSGWTF